VKNTSGSTIFVSEDNDLEVGGKTGGKDASSDVVADGPEVVLCILIL